MKNGDIFYRVSVWTYWNKPNPDESDFGEYTHLGSCLNDDCITSLVIIYKEANKMKGDGWDHMFLVDECIADNELEGGYELANSMNYEEWFCLPKSKRGE